MCQNLIAIFQSIKYYHIRANLVLEIEVEPTFPYKKLWSLINSHEQSRTWPLITKLFVIFERVPKVRCNSREMNPALRIMKLHLICFPQVLQLRIYKNQKNFLCKRISLEGSRQGDRTKAYPNTEIVPVSRVFKRLIFFESRIMRLSTVVIDIEDHSDGFNGKCSTLVNCS